MRGINFNRGQGGLGRQLPGEDHISGVMGFMATANVPSGFDVAIKTVYSWDQARALGFDVTSTDPDVALMAYTTKRIYDYNKKAIVYLYPVGGADNTQDFTKICDLQRFADGKIRQLGIVSSNTFAASDLTLIAAQRAIMLGENKPLEVVYGADTSAVSDLSTLTDLRGTLTAEGVSGVIGQSGNGLGLQMFTDLGVSIPAVGAAIGILSRERVQVNIGDVGRCNLVNNSDGDFDVPAFGNGVLVKTFPRAQLDAIDALGYIFIEKEDGVAGSYFNDSNCACPITSDYAYLENNRVINKAVRGIRGSVATLLKGNIYVDGDTGKLSEDTIATYKNAASAPLEQMKVDGEISDYEVIIDPDQNVLSTSKVTITPKIVPAGVAREIEVNISYEVKLGA